MNITDHINKNGYFIAAFAPTSYLPSFAYTIGLWEKFHHPEVICIGMPVDMMTDLLQTVATEVQSGRSIETGKEDNTVFDGSRAMFLPVDSRNLRAYFGYAIEHYQSANFSAIQLVWTDHEDRFPWDVNFDEALLYRQPLLDRNADFKYLEPANLSVFTTRQHLESGDPILTVVHDPDGDWQFLTNNETDEDARVVTLQSVIAGDLTLNEVFDLEYGEMASRDQVGGTWKREPFSFDEEA